MTNYQGTQRRAVQIRRMLAQISGRWLLIGWLVVAIQAQPGRGENDFILRARPYERSMRIAAARYGLDPLLLQVVAYLESRFSPRAISPRGARGMMQFMPGTAARYQLRNPHHPPAAIEAAAQYLHDLSLRFQQRADLVLAAYNAGETTVDAYLNGRRIIIGRRVINPKGILTGGVPPYQETCDYVARGLTLLHQLRAASSPATTRRGSQKNIAELVTPMKVRMLRRSIRATTDNGAREASQKSKIQRHSMYFGNGREE
jgi:soluble lytic murein transglycosylase-like protein